MKFAHVLITAEGHEVASAMLSDSEAAERNLDLAMNFSHYRWMMPNQATAVSALHYAKLMRAGVVIMQEVEA